MTKKNCPPSLFHRSFVVTSLRSHRLDDHCGRWNSQCRRWFGDWRCFRRRYSRWSRAVSCHCVSRITQWTRYVWEAIEKNRHCLCFHFFSRWIHDFNRIGFQVSSRSTVQFRLGLYGVHRFLHRCEYLRERRGANMDLCHRCRHVHLHRAGRSGKSTFYCVSPLRFASFQWPQLMPDNETEKFNWIRFACVTGGYMVGVFVMFGLGVLTEEVVPKTGER